MKTRPADATGKPGRKRMTGSREINKAEKRERIKRAARLLFSKKGYDNTTVREIALRAGVALGTLSLYAKDKRDLILLMFNDENTEMIETAQASVAKDEMFINNLMSFFRVFYMTFSVDLRVSRTFLQMNFFSDSANSVGMDYNRDMLLAGIRDIVDLAKTNSQIAGETPSEVIAQSLFFAYAGAVRWWIAEDKPDLHKGLEQLRALFQLQLDGCCVRGDGSEALAK